MDESGYVRDDARCRDRAGAIRHVVCTSVCVYCRKPTRRTGRRVGRPPKHVRPA